jgi:signal transduction histidine kinase
VLLRTQGLREELIEAVDEIVNTTERMNQLLNELLDLARLEAGRESLEITSFDAAELLTGLCNSMRPMAQEKGLELVSQEVDHLPVRGDRLKVHRIAQNLVLNALTYTTVGQVEVGWRSEPPDRWLFYVQDSGPGLPFISAGALAGGLEEAIQDDSPDEVDVTGGAQVSGTTGGEGIGLLIVHRLCELLDGVIEVESKPENGTIFKITLPVDYPQV